MFCERAFHRMDAILDRGIFRRQTERIEAHREQHVVSLHPHVTRARIGGSHRKPVTDVQVTAGVRQHGQRVVFRFALVDHRAVQLVRFPFLLPLLFHRLRLIGFILSGWRRPSFFSVLTGIIAFGFSVTGTTAFCFAFELPQPSSSQAQLPLVFFAEASSGFLALVTLLWLLSLVVFDSRFLYDNFFFTQFSAGFRFADALLLRIFFTAGFLFADGHRNLFYCCYVSLPS